MEKNKVQDDEDEDSKNIKNNIEENKDLNINNVNNNDSKSQSKIEKNEIIEDEEIMDYDNYEDDMVDNVQSGQEEVLESMFINAKNAVNENKLELFLDIISLDESKEKIWSYKCYEEICLIYIEFEDYLHFSENYKLLMNAGRTLSLNSLRVFVEHTVIMFLNEIKTHSKESIAHWLEVLTEDFNRFEQDKVLNMFEAKIYLKILVLSKGGDIQTKKYEEGKRKESIFDLDIIQYISDKEKLEQYTHEYLIKECECHPKDLDKKGNTFFYFSNKQTRGGEPYEPPKGWIAFGIEVCERYGPDQLDWLSNDGREGEWAVAYHGFGCIMKNDQIKSIIKIIIHDNLKPGGGQAYSQSPDIRHPNKKCGVGVYVTPNINVALTYAGSITLGNKIYKVVIMVRVNPKYIRVPENQQDYWILDGLSNQIRPYRLLLKEDTSNYFYQK